MECYICGNKEITQILDKNPINIWVGSGDRASNYSSVPCRLFQCLGCGHIQQEIDKHMEGVLQQIYNSSHSQASTPVGKGDWGFVRAKQIIEELDLNNFNSALEIGCADGYILRYLKTQGLNDLWGIEPSIANSYEEDGINYIKEFLGRPNLILDKKFDFIFAVCVFEHIKDINGVMVFIRDHLNDEGELFFEVPNSSLELRSGGPAVFMHEHIHYYTKSSLNVLLERNGFQVRHIKEIRDSYFVHAYRKNNFDVSMREIISYADYNYKLDSILTRMSENINTKCFAFHGVCSALNNIIGWSNLRDDFGLFDNDEIKIGKRYFKKEVHSPTAGNTTKYNCIIVVPYIYFEEIEKQYKDLEFEGEIIKVGNV